MVEWLTSGDTYKECLTFFRGMRFCYKEGHICGRKGLITGLKFLFKIDAPITDRAYK